MDGGLSLKDAASVELEPVAMKRNVRIWKLTFGPNSV